MCIDIYNIFVFYILICSSYFRSECMYWMSCGCMVTCSLCDAWYVMRKQMKVTYFAVPTWENMLIENMLGLDADFNMALHWRCTVISSNKLYLLKNYIFCNGLHCHCILCTYQYKKIYLKQILYSSHHTEHTVFNVFLYIYATFNHSSAYTCVVLPPKKISCKCRQVSVGQTDASVETGVEEHHQNICLEQPDKLAVEEHSFSGEHDIQFQDTKVLSSDQC